MYWMTSILRILINGCSKERPFFHLLEKLIFMVKMLTKDVCVFVDPLECIRSYEQCTVLGLLLKGGLFLELLTNLLRTKIAS